MQTPLQTQMCGFVAGKYQPLGSWARHWDACNGAEVGFSSDAIHVFQGGSLAHRVHAVRARSAHCSCTRSPHTKFEGYCLHLSRQIDAGYCRHLLSCPSLGVLFLTIGIGGHTSFQDFNSRPPGLQEIKASLQELKTSHQELPVSLQNPRNETQPSRPSTLTQNRRG